MSINYLFKLKKENTFIDAGLGITWARINGKIFKKSYIADEEHFVNVIPSIGYRRHSRKDLMWRISITPVANEDTFVPWVGFSIGKRF